MPGTLFIVATPIGNLEDISLRALRTLREVDLIAAEDTRRTAKLLSHYNIHRPMVSLHEHNEHRESPKLIARMEAGSSVALVSDAGTPGISDPGEHLVRLARARGITVTPIPGPSAITTALSASGLPASRFVFMGFVPRSGSARQHWFTQLAAEPQTVVFFEVPHRLDSLLADLDTYLSVVRPIQIYRELTKIHEEMVISPIMPRERAGKAIGEFVIVVGPAPQDGAKAHGAQERLEKAARLVGCLTTYCGFNRIDATAIASKAMDVDPRHVKKAVKRAGIEARRRSDRLP